MSSPATLVKKLAEVMKEVGKIPKTGTNLHFNYKYVKESDLVEKLSELLANRHIFITSRTKNIETVELSKVLKNGEVAVMKMGILHVEYTFHDGESGETLTLESVGEIDQDGGKGLYKALTGAMKYFLMKNFLIATGDDPEQSGPQKVAHNPTKPAFSQPYPIPSTVEQQAKILDLCKELQLDVQKDICAKAKWVWPLTASQAELTIKKLEQNKKNLQKELDAKAQ